MATPCAHYALLRNRIDELSGKFVNDQAIGEQTDPTTFQPDLDRLAAFRLLVHAELEDFLEAKAREHLAKLSALAAVGSGWMRQLPGLIALAIAVAKPIPIVNVTDTQKVQLYLNEVLCAAARKINENNGIKSQSFTVLSICAGKAFDEVDNFLSGSLNSYGTSRGDVAHKSVTHSSSLLAPSAELANARSLETQLAAYFDVCV